MLALEGVSRSFGATRALSSVRFEAKAGEITALLGENGAGKSTLMSLLSGIVSPDEGAMTLGGQPFAPRSPGDAKAQGVAMVHQEVSLCPHLTVEENLLLGIEPTRHGVIDRAAVRRRADEVLSEVCTGSIHADAVVATLGPAEQQLVEIARALAQPACRLLLLDEPTSSLTRAEIERLFSLLRRLRERGLAIVYVSHFLEEVLELCDRYVVLRDGALVGEGAIEGATAEGLVSMMAGRAIEQIYPRSERTQGEPVLHVEGLAGELLPAGVSLTLHRGEVLGVAGLMGSGRTELLRAVFGLDRVRDGRVRLAAHIGPFSPSRSLAIGMGLLSEDRKGEGLCLGLTVADNVTLSRLPGLLSPARLAAEAKGLLERLSVKARGPGQVVGELSGGNQQKVALARLLHRDVDVFLLDEPTRGIDVGAKAQIYAEIDRLARSGKAVLLVSSYLPELLGVADRIAVMRRGKLGAPRAVAAVTEQSLLAEALSP